MLHREDIAVLRQGHASHRHLTTIRKGEPAFNPVLDRVLPAAEEVVRVSGQPKSWTCLFYEHGEEESACKIYEHRFVECRALRCWDPDELLEIIGKDTICRSDLLNPNDPLRELIDMHERKCPYEEVERLVRAVAESDGDSDALSRLTDLVRRDLAIRLFATSEVGLDPAIEMFAFGRPIFKSLTARGFELREQDDTIHLDWSPGEATEV